MLPNLEQKRGIMQKYLSTCAPALPPPPLLTIPDDERRLLYACLSHCCCRYALLSASSVNVPRPKLLGRDSIRSDRSVDARRWMEGVSQMVRAMFVCRTATSKM